MRANIFLIVALTSCSLFGQERPKIPFEGMNLTWINGQNRQTEFPLAYKDVLTGVAYLDGYFNYNFADPIDNTQTISATTGRHKEFTVNLMSIGVESYYKNAIGRLWLQTGQMLEIIQETDGSVGKGRNTGTDNLRFIREAAAGYHFNTWYGINVEMGIFMSYIGLESYVTQENWSYQRSMVCDFTPFYFSGARLQAFPSKTFKTELWLLNGWQTYSSWNRSPAIGSSNYFRPTENLQLVANFYVGRDTRNANTTRFHHDNSIVARYHAQPDANGISQAAFSVNTHYGFQHGSGVDRSDQYMTGTSVAHRLWFGKNRFGMTVRGDYITNPGLYLAFNPSPVADNDFNDAIAGGERLKMSQLSLTFDIMPNDFVTFRFEYAHRHANIPYFAGSGGTTSPDGWLDTDVGDFRPDLRKDEDRIIVAMNFRI